MSDWLDLKEAAVLVDKSPGRLRAMCVSGELRPARQVPAKDGGTKLKWQLHKTALESFGNREKVSYDALVAEWKEHQANGLLTGAKLEPSTVITNVSGLSSMWTYSKIDPSINRFTTEAVRLAIAAVPAEKKGAAISVFRGSKSFYKFLVRKGLRPKGDLVEFIEFKPPKNKDPKRYFLKSEAEFEAMRAENEVWLWGRSEYDRLLTGILILALYLTGMRIGEICKLQLEDVDFEEDTLSVLKTKDKTSRRIGMAPQLKEGLRAYLKKRPASKSNALFLQEDGTKLTNKTALLRVRGLGARCGITITPHGFRRTFITQKLKEGIPVALLQKITGHKKLLTLQLYDMSTDEDALDILRGNRSGTERKIALSAPAVNPKLDTSEDTPESAAAQTPPPQLDRLRW